MKLQEWRMPQTAIAVVSFLFLFLFLFLLFLIRPSLCSFRVIRSQLPKENDLYLANGQRVSTDVSKDVKKCVVCGMPGPKSCGKCHTVNYCSRDHQVAHWGLGHKEKCGKATNAEELKSHFDKLLGQFRFPEYEVDTEEEVLDG